MDKIKAGDIVFAMVGFSQSYSKCKVNFVTQDSVCSLQNLAYKEKCTYTLPEDKVIKYNNEYHTILNDLIVNKSQKVLDILGQGSYKTKVAFYDVYFSKNRDINITFPEHLSTGGFGVYRVYFKQMNKFNKVYTTNTFSLKNPPLTLYDEIKEAVDKCFEIIKIKEAYKSKKGL